MKETNALRKQNKCHESSLPSDLVSTERSLELYARKLQNLCNVVEDLSDGIYDRHRQILQDSITKAEECNVLFERILQDETLPSYQSDNLADLHEDLIFLLETFEPVDQLQPYQIKPHQLPSIGVLTSSAQLSLLSTSARGYPREKEVTTAALRLFEYTTALYHSSQGSGGNQTSVDVKKVDLALEYCRTTDFPGLITFLIAEMKLLCPSHESSSYGETTYPLHSQHMALKRLLKELQQTLEELNAQLTHGSFIKKLLKGRLTFESAVDQPFQDHDHFPVDLEILTSIEDAAQALKLAESKELPIQAVIQSLHQSLDWLSFDISTLPPTN